MSRPSRFQNTSTFAERTDRRKFAIMVFLGVPAVLCTVLYVGHFFMEKSVFASIVNPLSHDAGENLYGLTERETEMLRVGYDSSFRRDREAISRLREFSQKTNELGPYQGNDKDAFGRGNTYTPLTGTFDEQIKLPQVPCRLCGAVGATRDGQKCTRCGGRGSHERSEEETQFLRRLGPLIENCTVCGGRGTMSLGTSCPRCGGTGIDETIQE